MRPAGGEHDADPAETAEWREAFAALVQSQGAPRARFMLYNGVHVDGFAPQILVEWKTFLDLYVAKRVPSIDSKLRAIAPTLFKRTFGASLEIPPDRLADQPSHAAALALYEKEPAVRVLFESGAGSGGMSELGSPEAAYDKKFTQWPPQETTAQRWYFGDGGVLQATAPTAMTGAATWQHDPDAGQRGHGRICRAEPLRHRQRHGSRGEGGLPRPVFQMKSLHKPKNS